jgi:hypothetical protein
MEQLLRCVRVCVDTQRSAMQFGYFYDKLVFNIRLEAEEVFFLRSLYKFYKLKVLIKTSVSML